MGNNPSAQSKSPTSNSISSSAFEPSRGLSNRRDPRNLIQAQRAPAEPSLTQALGITAAHRVRSKSLAANINLNQPSPAQCQNPTNPGKHLPVESKQASKSVVVDDEPSKPVDVPVSASNIENATARNFIQSIEAESTTLHDMSYNLTRPPRLPLPIEEEVHTPGSPIITPVDLYLPIIDAELHENETLPRPSSTLSNSTIDEEDAEELRFDKTKATVPIVFEWCHGGDKVYVTGTIFQWNKKYCLHPVASQPGVFRAVIHVRPGTHHIRFIKDSVMLCSPDLPTTVDFGNNLVNYIEVSADDLPDEKTLSVHESSFQNTKPTNVHNQHIPREPNNPDGENTEAVKSPPKSRTVLPPDRYTSQIPQYIVDLDKPEDSSEYRNAAAAIEKLPTPPSLPGFLGKPILNAATALKDDNSVLIMPNHTVLNHLATSSIKNNVLGVSVTTRYKRKYVTTIMYKPTSDE